MIAKTSRLKANRVKYVLLKGKRAGNNYFSFKYLPNNNTKCRFAVVVSAKIDSSAVKRNLIRRRTYEILRLNESNFNKSFDIVIITKPEITKLDYQSLNKELTYCINNNIFHEKR